MAITKSTELYQTEATVEYKSRVGKSPDIADAAFILVDLCRTRHGFMGGERFAVNKGRQKTWTDKMRSLDITATSSRTLLDT